jgi:hypothetical protein
LAGITFSLADNLANPSIFDMHPIFRSLRKADLIRINPIDYSVPMGCLGIEMRALEALDKIDTLLWNSK